MEIPRLKEKDCAKCDSLCCQSLAIEELAKKAGIPCRHLLADGKCSIHPKAAGMDSDTRPDVCGDYSCAGAGEIVTDMFNGIDMVDGKTKRIRDVIFMALQYGSMDIEVLHKYIDKFGNSGNPAVEIIAEYLDRYHTIRDTHINLFRGILAYDVPKKSFVEVEVFKSSAEHYVESISKLLDELGGKLRDIDNK